MEKLKLERFLKVADQELPNALNKYQSLLGERLSFMIPSPFTLTPEKTYTARSQVKIKPAHEPEKTRNIIAFACGDGTGDNSLYSGQELIIPMRYEFKTNQERVFPRIKKETVMEAFFPFFSILDSSIHKNTACLEELSVKESNGKLRISHLGWLGEIPTHYNEILNENRKICKPEIGLTKGYKRNGDTFGMPHSTLYPTQGINSDALQIVGFLGLTKEDQYLMDIIDKIASVPK